jgi:hypothetical protein
MAAGANPDELLKKLDDLHRAYLDTFTKAHEALAHQLGGNTAVSPAGPSRRRRRSTLDPDAERPLVTNTTSARHINFGTSDSTIFGTNESSFSDDISDDDDELYVQDTLPPYKFDTEHLRDHLRHYKFNESGMTLLETVVNQSGRLLNPSALFPQYPSNELYHNSHYTVFDVGKDGAPVSRRKVVESGSTIDSAIWQAIRVRAPQI